VGDGVIVGLGVGLGVTVGVSVGVAVKVLVAVGVRLGVRVYVGVSVGVNVDVGVGVSVAKSETAGKLHPLMVTANAISRSVIEMDRLLNFITRLLFVFLLRLKQTSY
jgi:hypothetical protein